MDSWRWQYGSIWVFVHDARTACMWFELLRCLAAPDSSFNVVQVATLQRSRNISALGLTQRYSTHGFSIKRR